jgi:hypothetical protein
LTLAATGAEQAAAAVVAEEWQALIAATAAGAVIEGDGAGGARFVGAVEPSTNVASLTVEKLESLLLGKLSQQQQLDRIDSIPLLETSSDRPEALFRLQRTGELVTTNLLSTAQYALCITGYYTWGTTPPRPRDVIPGAVHGWLRDVPPTARDTWAVVWPPTARSPFHQQGAADDDPGLAHACSLPLR